MNRTEMKDLVDEIVSELDDVEPVADLTVEGLEEDFEEVEHFVANSRAFEAEA